MGHDRIDHPVNVHEPGHPVEQLDVVSLEGNSEWRLKVALSNTVFDGDVDYPLVLVVFLTGLLLPAALNVLLDGLVDKDLHEVRVLLAVDLEVGASPEGVG